MTRRNAILQTIITVGPIIGGPGFLLTLAGVFCRLQPQLPDWIFAIAGVSMIPCAGLVVQWVFFFPTYLAARFMLRQTRRAFALRPRPAVPLNSPGLFFVDIVPRINWGKPLMESASDIGFLELDKARRELVFEGDHERYWIPVEAILEIRQEFWADSVQPRLPSLPPLNHVVVVRAMTAEGPWETWFYRRHNKFVRRTAKRRLADALELENKIRELMKPAR